MGQGGAEFGTLLQRLRDEEVKYASHHRVTYHDETLKAIIFIAQTFPYVREDLFETAIDLLDESGAEVRVRKVVTNGDQRPEVGLEALASVVTRKTGRNLSEFIR